MKLDKINYQNLNSRQKEIYNFQKVAALLADYGFNCIKLADDWQGADFLAYHKDGIDTLKVQLKGRLHVNQKYEGKEIYMAFPIDGNWHLIEHDELLKVVEAQTVWLASKAWKDTGAYDTPSPSKALKAALSDYQL